jgi:hypothetical protein
MINVQGVTGKQEDWNWISSAKLNIVSLQELTYAYVSNAYLL